MKEKYTKISIQNLASNVTYISRLLYTSLKRRAKYHGVETFGLVTASDADTAFISAAMIYNYFTVMQDAFQTI